MNKSLKLIAVAVGLMAMSATASAFDTAKCKACHAIDKDGVGPSWKSVADTYGSADALAAEFKSGFAVDTRKMAASNEKWKKSAGTMTGQFNSLIKGHEDEAAKALFDAVAAGKM